MFRIFGLACLLLTCSVQLSIGYTKIVSPYPQRHIQGVTYEKLQEVFQMYPVDQRMTNVFVAGRCGTLHGSRETTHRWYYQHTYNGPSHPRSKPCYSKLRNCWAEDYMSDDMTFCLSRNSSSRRYDSMKIFKSGLSFGPRPFIESTCYGTEFYYKYFHAYPCMCDCESSEREADRYFSLRDVVADKDKIVTGFRIRKIDHVFYIQIQQATLGRDLKIKGPVEWKDVEAISKSELLSDSVSYYDHDKNDLLLEFRKNDLVYAVTADQKKVHLGILKVDKNSQGVVTGLRFSQKDDVLTLNIRVTTYALNEGLQENSSYWKYSLINSDSFKGEILLETPDDPAKHTEYFGGIYGNSIVKFRTSDFAKDLGQTTVPFIDIQEVVNDPPTPIIGAAIYLKTYIGSAGFLGLAGHFEELI